MQFAKATTPAADFLRKLCREGRLTTLELTASLHALAFGGLRPTLATPANPTPRKPRRYRM